MAAIVVNWPSNLRPSDRTDPQLQFNTRSGGVSMSGIEQVISPLSSRWRWRAIFPVINKGQARAARVAKGQLMGRFNYLRIRICDQYRISRREVGMWSDDDPVPHGDGSGFDDGSGYEIAQPASPITAYAAAGSTSISIRASDMGDGMVAGVFFSIDDRLYQVETWELVGTNYVIGISPPLRAAVDEYNEADFNAWSMWQLDDDMGASTDLRGGRFGALELSLSEAFPT